MLAEHRERERSLEASVFSLPMETLIVGCSGASLVLFASSIVKCFSITFAPIKIASFIAIKF